MKKIIFVCSMLLLCGVAAIAQKGKEAFREKIDSYRSAFITERLNLTPEEAQKFWPIYNQYHDIIEKLRDETPNRKSLDVMNDSEVEQYMNIRLDNEQKILTLKKEYIQKFKQVLSIRKVAILQEAEKEFRQEILKRAKAKRKGNDDN